ncbi:unnamed protein product [Thlaspi arvense]|uniref:Protein kinase domain-containing protein n=1 Tax=Thlaspi arvense TaxID=13288 RepID=A0AAU9RMH7_THLAR|nr:unnamed protein product [Thlaspi arvense]
MSFCMCFGPISRNNLTRNKKLTGNTACQESSLERPTSPADTAEAAPSSSLETRLRYELDTRRFEYRELANATNNFSRESLIGRGGFGPVHKGQLECTGQLKNVAVKILDPSGYYTTEEEVLDWRTRMKIAAGAARGLRHLHCEANPIVIYRDFKSSNILLDNGYKVKLSDFGLAKFGPKDDKTHVSTRVMGTQGYCAPEYAFSGKLSTKSDIYSFGVVMLELITGRRAIIESPICHSRLLVHWARQHFMNKNIKKIVDPMLRRQSDFMKEKTLEKALEVAFTCVKEDPYARPSISDVVDALDYIIISLRRRKKRKNIVHGEGIELETVPSKETMKTLNRNENDENERQRAVAEAKNWAENARLQTPSKMPAIPNSY